MADSSGADDSAVHLVKRLTPRETSEDLLGRLSGNFNRHNLGKIVGVGQGKKKYPVRQCRVCYTYKKQSETYICEFGVVPHHRGRCCEKCHTLKYY